MKTLRDFGEVNSWEAALLKALELYEAKEINAVATISLNEFRTGQWSAALLQEGDDIPPLVMIHGLAEVGPAVYPGNDRFRLLFLASEEIMSELNGPLVCLAVIYLKPDEQF